MGILSDYGFSLAGKFIKLTEPIKFIQITEPEAARVVCALRELAKIKKQEALKELSESINRRIK